MSNSFMKLGYFNGGPDFEVGHDTLSYGFSYGLLMTLQKKPQSLVL